MGAAYEDELPHGAMSTVRVLGREESLAAAGLTAATAPADLYAGEADSSGLWRPVASATHGGVPSFSEASADPADGPPVPAAGAPGILDYGAEVTVDIYVTVGLHGAWPNPSCDHNDKSNCGLWWIQMLLPSKTVLNVAQLQTTDPDGECPNGRSHVQAAASPDATRYAWHRGCKTGPYNANGDEVETNEIRVSLAPSEVGPPHEDIAYHTQRLTQFPNWYDEDTITFSMGAGVNTGQTLWAVTNPTSAPTVSAQTGPDAAVHTNFGYEDGFAHHPSKLGGAKQVPRIVTFGGLLDANPSRSQRIPQVTDIDGGNRETFRVPEAWRPNPNLDPECHHPAWNPFGTRNLCTRYQDSETWSGYLADLSTPWLYELRRLFAFQKGTLLNQWRLTGADSFGTVGALVEPLTDAEFNNIPGFGSNLFPPRKNTAHDSPGCTTYVWKFAEWCASERFLVATVYCTGTTLGDDGYPTALHSRVVLIDTENSGSAAGYTDLTTIIEMQFGPPQVGQYSGFFASCGSSQTILGAMSSFAAVGGA